MTCPHPDFAAFVDVNRIVASEAEESDSQAPARAFMAEIRIDCAVCGERMVFVGAPIGMLYTKPCIGPDGLELRVPLRPQSQDPHFGMGLPGFIARVNEGDPSSGN